MYALHRLAGTGIQGDGVGDLGWLAKTFPSCLLYVASSRRSDMAEKVKRVDRDDYLGMHDERDRLTFRTPIHVGLFALFIGSALVTTDIPI